MVHYVLQNVPQQSLDDQESSYHMPQTVSPEQVGAEILKTLKATAERHLDGPVTMTVMSVPAEFNEIQRNYTKKAAQLAGEFGQQCFLRSL